MNCLKIDDLIQYCESKADHFYDLYLDSEDIAESFYNSGRVDSYCDFIGLLKKLREGDLYELVKENDK